MLSTIDVNVFSAEEAFYKEPFHFSYSSLNKLLLSPIIFYNLYVLKKREVEKIESHLIDGKVIHCLLLESETVFNEKFVVSPKKLPGETIKTIVDKIFRFAQANDLLDKELKDHEFLILDILRNMDLHQKLTNDEKRMGKIVTPEAESYYSFLLEKDKKEVIDEDTFMRCLESVNILKSNPNVVKALGLDIPNDNPNYIIYRELYLEKQLPSYGFGLKGVLDGVLIDKIEKVIYITDLKTTSKVISEFSETVDYYKYWLQAAVYVQLIKEQFPLLIAKGYSIKYKFVVIDKYKQTYVFDVLDTTLNEWLFKLNKVLDVAKYHYDTKNYSLPFDFLVKQITI